MSARVVFASKCWGGDYEKFLSGAFDRKYAAIGYPFDTSLLVVNNGVPEEAEMDLRALAHGIVVYTEETEPRLEELLGFVPNVYARGELTACFEYGRADYLAYVQGDCLTSGGDWVTPGIRILESEPEVMVVSPASEVNTWHDREGYDRYMSDQAWLVRNRDFQDPAVYQVQGTDPDYPGYGGDSFEHLVGKYLKATGKKRKILTGFYVQHPAY